MKSKIIYLAKQICKSYQLIYQFLLNLSFQMLNFNSLFNQWRSQPASGLNQLIDSPNITLGRLLDEDQFMSQYKSGSIKITEFMNYNRYEELIDFVTVVGPPQDKKRSYKYPLTACELLSMEKSNTNYLELFLPEKPFAIIIQTKTFENVQQQVQVQIDEPPQVTQAQEKIQNIQTLQEKGEIEQKKVAQQVPVKKQPENQAQDKKEDPVQVGNQIKQQQNQKKEVQAEAKVVKKNTIKVKTKVTKRVQKITQEKKQPLILKLLSYFKGQVNYTLAGYVSKILGFLLNKKPVEFFKFVLEESKINQILNHAESRSVGELIVKILTHQSTHALELRQFFYKQLLARLSVSSEIYVISNLSTYACQIIQKVSANLKSNNKVVELSNIFFSLEIIASIIKNVMSQDENISVYNAPILLTYLTNVPFVLPEDQTVIQQFKKLVQLFISKSCEKLQVQHRNRPKLGGGRIKLLQILKFVLKQNLLNSKDIVASKTQFFPILLRLMKEYQMNNVLHNEVIKILDIALLEGKQSALNKAILADDFLVNFISSETEEDKKIKSGNSIYKSRKGYIAHIINLAIRLKQLSSTNDNLKALIISPQFLTIYDSFVEKENINTRKSLAGFVKKDNKHEIMFQKQDIIAAYLTFFQKCPSAVFEPEPKAEEHVNIQHPDFVEELQKQLQENLTIKPKEGETESSTIAQKQKEKQVTAEEQIQEEQKAQGQYWTTHLQYNIDDLINEL